MQNQINFKAKWIRDLYRSEHYAVAILEDCDTGREYKCTGALVPSIKNIKYDIAAIPEKDERYGGIKYTITSCAMAECTGRKDMVLLLSSGIFPGIGKSTAGKIYDRFGDNVLTVIRDDPVKLLNIKGITLKKAEKIHNSYEDHLYEARLFQYLTPFGFSPQQIHKIKSLSCEGDPVLFIKTSPYAAMKVHGVTFEMADAVAKDNSVEDTDPERLAAAAEDVIKKIMRSGHAGVTYASLAEGLTKTANSKEVDARNIKLIIKGMLASHTLSYRKIRDRSGNAVTYYYLPYVLNIEQELANLISSCISDTKSKNLGLAVALLSAAERDNKLTLDGCQKEAIITALTSGISIITGGPGTGKTTIIKILAAVWKKIYRGKKDIVLMSPTGKAARRMAEATGLPAATIHSILRLVPSDETEVMQAEETDIKDSLVVIDEVSMLDMFVANEAFKHFQNCVIVLIGDSDQLPSVGCGKVLSDLIESKALPVTALSYTHRQEAGSGICRNAERIREGADMLYSNPDFNIFVLSKSPEMKREEVMQMIEDKMLQEYLHLTDIYEKDNVVALCPFNKGPAGQLSLNARLQNALNPESPGKHALKASGSMTFREGDPVMQLVNIENVANGEVGIVTDAGRINGSECLRVQYPDRLVSYTRDEIDQIALSYAMTVHKSQGSEYDAVVTCMTGFHGAMVRRNVLYTAVTRAKKKVVLIGETDAIREAIRNDRIEERNTMLWHDLTKHYKTAQTIIFNPKAAEKAEQLDFQEYINLSRGGVSRSL